MLADYEWRDIEANGVEFMFADGWRKCFSNALDEITNESEACALVTTLLGLLQATDFVRVRHFPAWEADGFYFTVRDADGRAWQISLFLNDGETVVHKVTLVRE